MTFDTNLKAVTEKALLPKAVDSVLNSNVHTSRTLGNMKAWRGETLDKSFIYQTGGQGGSFSGFDKFNTASVNTKIRLSFDPRGYEIPVVLGGMEVAVNANSDRSVDLVAEAMEEASNEGSDQVGGYLYADGTGNSSKDFLGLAAIVDDGGEVATYGGQSRTTYTTLKANETDLGGALTLAAMATMYDSCKRGNDKPNILYTTEAIWSDYEALNQAGIQNNQDGYRQATAKSSVRTVDALKGEMGFDALTYRGALVVADEKCTSGTMWFINERWIAFYGLKATLDGYTPIMVGGNQSIEGVYEDEPRESLGFSWSGFKQPVDQFAEIGHILLLGNYVSFNPNRHGVLNTIS